VANAMESIDAMRAQRETERQKGGRGLFSINVTFYTIWWSRPTHWEIDK